MGAAFWRRLMRRWIVLVPVFVALGSGSAHASCTYNVGSNPSFQAIEFRSVLGYFGGYSSWDLGPGQSQCWYGHGWDLGWFGPAHQWAETSWPDALSVNAHGWIDICLYESSSVGAWAYKIFGANGMAVAYAAGVVGGDDEYPPGCKGPLGSGSLSTPTKGAVKTGPLPGPSSSSGDAEFFTAHALSGGSRSITFHLYNTRHTPVASVCMPPGDVSHLNLELARRMGVNSVYVGVTEHAQSCGDAKLAGRERAGRPLADHRFVAFCEPTSGRGVMTYRYPADFGRRTRPACSKS